ncbi:glycosyltransferase family 2 protein [Rhizobium sp. UBA1881]|uniref:glycosyltransferase family 2 protein n=1 Tax=Rhizobium sp. UBA1881 TaxID=1947375 RepID=UPI000DD7005A|nr:glycosyltransferase family 2 protein [Rhizobium sp. UBA1881]
MKSVTFDEHAVKPRVGPRLSPRTVSADAGAMAGDSHEAPTLLSVVVPCYNEQEVLPLFFERIVDELERIADIDFEIVCVNDGSRDNTLAVLLGACRADARIRAIDLSRNFGKEAALSAAIAEARGDIIVPIDADLQDPPELIARMIEKWREGYDVVLAKRMDRSADTLAKRWAAAAFYRLHNALSDVEIPENAGDFRLISRDVADALVQLPERHRFMKGLFAWVGFRAAEIEYKREPRAAGKTKFSFWKLWNFAVEGVTSFSTLPMRIWTYIGTFVAFCAVVRAVMLTVRTLIWGVDVPGYASLATAILLLGGIQLIGLGILGEYVGRIYFEVKGRPIYVVRGRYGSRV